MIEVVARSKNPVEHPLQPCSPAWILRPLVMLCLRIISTAWVVYVVLGLYSAEVHDRLDDVAQPRLGENGWHSGDGLS